MYERRFNATQFRVLEGTNLGSAGTLVGYASIYSTPGSKYGLSEDMGGWRERCSFGMAKRYLTSNPDIKGLRDHNPSLILCRTANGTLKLAEDGVGLRCEMNIADTSTGRDTMVLVRSGTVDQMSFAFAIDGSDGESWDEEPDYDDPDGERKLMVRTLRAVKIYDASIVTSPAYPDARVGVKDAFVIGRALENAPAEVRSRVAAYHNSNGERTRRQNAVNLFLGL